MTGFISYYRGRPVGYQRPEGKPPAAWWHTGEYYRVGTRVKCKRYGWLGNVTFVAEEWGTPDPAHVAHHGQPLYYVSYDNTGGQGRIECWEWSERIEQYPPLRYPMAKGSETAALAAIEMLIAREGLDRNYLTTEPDGPLTAVVYTPQWRNAEAAKWAYLQAVTIGYIRGWQAHSNLTEANP